MGKKRIKCSGGGNTVMSLMRASSVWLVRSAGRLTGFAYQASVLATVALAVMVRLLIQTVEGDENKGAKKNRRVSRRFL